MNNKKIPITILGATGVVGQRFIELVHRHPWFEIAGLTASERSQGRDYGEAAAWGLNTPLPDSVGRMKLLGPADPLPSRRVLSALPGGEAGPMEAGLARLGHIICSNAAAHRTDPLVPLLVPEVNADHLNLLPAQRRERGWSGALVTTPNCTTTILTLALCPLHRAFGLRRAHAVSMQGLSGAGYPGVPSLDVIDNIVPRIPGEEEKLTTEPRKLLGRFESDLIHHAPFAVSAQCSRVPVREGHLVCVNAEFERRPTVDQVIEAMESFSAPEVSDLPSAPGRPVLVTRDPARPQPRMDRNADHGMSVVVGRVRPSATAHIQFLVAGHNTLRGAAGGTLLNAELLHLKEQELS